MYQTESPCFSFTGIQNGSPCKGNSNLMHDDTAPNSALKCFLPFSVCHYRPYTLL